MATFTVTNTENSGAGSLRQAILDANAAIGADEIGFDAALAGQTIGLTDGSLVITDGLAIRGPGASGVTVSAGSNIFDVFRIEADGIAVVLDRLVIEGGEDSIEIPGSADRNTLTISNSTVGRTPVFGDDGLSVDGDRNTVTVENSVFENAEDNLAVEDTGSNNLVVVRNSIIRLAREDGVEVDGNNNRVTVENSTIVDNGDPAANPQAPRPNDGFDVDGAGNTIELRQVTISSNGEDGLDIEGPGNAVTVDLSTIARNVRDGVLNQDRTGASTITLSNTIVAGNGPDVASDAAGGVRSAGHNLVGNGTWVPVREVPGDPAIITGFVSTGRAGFDGPGDQVGSLDAPLDPRLGPLQNNGGPTPTHALLPGSPAINAGDPAFAPPPEFDQRGPGFPRVLGGRIDIGAFEASPARLQATIEALRVIEAGEDGIDRNAEWRLDFFVGNERVFRFSNDAVRDGAVFPVGRDFPVDPSDPAAPTLTLRTSGFEDDPVFDDDLPSTRADLTFPGFDGLPLRLTLTGQDDDFAYAVNWRVGLAEA